MQNSDISRGYVNKYVIDDKHFTLCFTGLVDRMLKANEINADLNNLTKMNFKKFENFIQDKIEQRVRQDNINMALNGKSKTNNQRSVVKKKINL